MTIIPAAGMTDVYPHLLKGFSLQPQAHVHYGKRCEQPTLLNA